MYPITLKLCSNRLIPKASHSLPPASYLLCSLTAPLLLIINLSLWSECFGKHPLTASGRCCSATWGIRKESLQSRSARWNTTKFTKAACGRCTHQGAFSGCCTSTKELFPELHRRQGEQNPTTKQQLSETWLPERPFSTEHNVQQGCFWKEKWCSSL